MNHGACGMSKWHVCLACAACMCSIQMTPEDGIYEFGRHLIKQHISLDIMTFSVSLVSLVITLFFVLHCGFILHLFSILHPSSESICLFNSHTWTHLRHRDHGELRKERMRTAWEQNIYLTRCHHCKHDYLTVNSTRHSLWDMWGLNEVQLDVPCISVLP